MTSLEVRAYLAETADRPTRDDLKFAVSLIAESPEPETSVVAVDCGCGAGSDIAYLRAAGFLVHAFDVESEAIRRCRERFAGDEGVQLTQTDFAGFQFPSANLINADASLFYCPPQAFQQVWQAIDQALQPSGVFSGSFLGPRDTTAGPDYDREAYWPEVLVMTEEEVRSIFAGFELLRFQEHELDGLAGGKPHHWHIFSVVAQKR